MPSERHPSSWEDWNSTLGIEQRTANLAEVYHYALPSLAAEGVSLDVAFRVIHGVAARGMNAGGLEGVADRLAAKGIDASSVFLNPEQYRDRATTDMLGYSVAIKGVGYSTLDGQYTLHIACPREEWVPYLMKGISDRFEGMLSEVQNADDAIKLAAWASQLGFLVHPYYDGNGRASNAAFTFALMRAGHPPICVENPRNDTSARALPFLMNLNLKTVLNLYSKNMSVLPNYIPLSRDPVTAADILGLPPYAPLEEVKAQKQSSLEQLLATHLEVVTMHNVRELFTEEDVATYRANAHPLPS